MTTSNKPTVKIELRELQFLFSQASHFAAVHALAANMSKERFLCEVGKTFDRMHKSRGPTTRRRIAKMKRV